MILLMSSHPLSLVWAKLPSSYVVHTTQKIICKLPLI